jgi:hypothetical protein
VEEAASLGKIVVTQLKDLPLYVREFGNVPPIVIANTPEELKEQVAWLLSLAPEEIIELQHKTREWAVNYHGYIPTAHRMKRLLGV